MNTTSVGLNVTFVGMFVVFAILVLLYLSIVLLGRIVSGKRESREASPVIVVKEEGKVDDRIVAVITAALATYMGDSGSIRIRNVTRVKQPSRIWASSGRVGIMNARLSPLERKG